MLNNKGVKSGKTYHKAFLYIYIKYKYYIYMFYIDR